jgi:signal transduction histidine kinase/ActR/RegA family two-component response regulator
VYPSIARLLNEHRPTTEGALQRALTAGLGAERARREAEALTDALAAAFADGGLATFVPELSRRIGAWQAAGVTAPGVEEALVTLARWPWLRDPADPLPDVPIEDVLRREVAQREKFSALLTVSRAVVNTLDLNTILTTIAKQIRQVIQTDECTVFLHDDRENVLLPAVCDAVTYKDEMLAVRLKPGEGITGAVALSGRGEIVNDAEADPRAMTVPGTPPEQSALLCVPLVSRERVLGVVTLSRLGPRGFQEEDLELATLFAGQCSAAIANARLYESIKLAYDELRATQAQLVQSAKLNALGEMAGGVAHDFNNILAAILGRTQLLLQSVDDPGIRRQLGVVEQAALDGAQTVRRVQEFTRVRQDERFETLDLNRVLYGVVELTRPAWEAGAKRRGVVVNPHLDLKATQSIAGAASELREVFTNMVLNAVDAMPAGGELWITSADEGDEVRVQVRDSGVGMDHDTRARVFDPFFTTKEVKGTGLGLSVAYGIVKRHRGHIDVLSHPGAGTEFTLTFPKGAIPVAHGPFADGPAPAALRALVADDEESVLTVLAEMLRGMGHQVSTALGGPAAIELIRQETFDIVFTDLGMPEVNGWDLAAVVKSRRPECAVVLVSGWGFQLEEDAAQSRGVDRVMAKPFSFPDVESALRALFDPQGQRRAA